MDRVNHHWLCPFGNCVWRRGCYRCVDWGKTYRPVRSKNWRGFPSMDLNQHDRRQVLKVIIGGVATALILPSNWTKPIITSMTAPAHAQASPASTTAPPTTQPPTTAPATTAPPQTTAPATTAPPQTTAPATTAPPPTTAPATTAPPTTQPGSSGSSGAGQSSSGGN